MKNRTGPRHALDRLYPGRAGVRADGLQTLHLPHSLHAGERFRYPLHFRKSRRHTPDPFTIGQRSHAGGRHWRLRAKPKRVGRFISRTARPSRLAAFLLALSDCRTDQTEEQVRERPAGADAMRRVPARSFVSALGLRDHRQTARRRASTRATSTRATFRTRPPHPSSAPVLRTRAGRRGPASSHGHVVDAVGLDATGLCGSECRRAGQRSHSRSALRGQALQHARHVGNGPATDALTATVRATPSSVLLSPVERSCDDATARDLRLRPREICDSRPVG